MTELERLQKAIDKCNNKSGCDSKCSKQDQERCKKLAAHAARMDYCRENNISIYLW